MIILSWIKVIEINILICKSNKNENEFLKGIVVLHIGVDHWIFDFGHCEGSITNNVLSLAWKIHINLSIYYYYNFLELINQEKVKS